MLDVHRLLALVVVLALSAAACATDRAAPRATATADSGAFATTLGPTPSATTPADPTSSPTPVAVAVFDEVPPLHDSVDGWQEGTVEVVAADGTAHHVAVRLATTAEQRSHGLMEVPDLPDGAGMWFAYGEERTGGFWMKNTLVPLDITYVGGDDRIVSVAQAEPCRQDPCRTYEPEGAYHNVLEVPAGYLDRIGAGVGDVVRLDP